MNYGLRKDRRGLSEVVSVLILLVVAVLLTAVVSYYATNVTRTRTNVEEVRFSRERIWVNETGAVAAFKIHNIGGRDILIGGIRVRGVEIDWDNVYYYRVPLGTTVAGEMNRTSYDDLTGSSVTISGLVYNQSYTEIPLISSGVILFYVKGPGNIQLSDVGTTVDLSIYTNNALYFTECNVESASDQ
ncbi:MAG: hypothetical protein JSV18_06480 [Candidatus Bathyarchaeota archaeon]|nr:MAG: hypothetical protein JSV18_06480 [Candidatus Bathyarchaeota archaeon]